MQNFQAWMNSFNGFVWGPAMLVLILGTGLYLQIRLLGMPIRRIGSGLRLVWRGRNVDPDLPGKTLVFCATDHHAQMVVGLLKQAFDEAYGGIDDDAVAKITGNTDRPNELIRRFKNERDPRIAVGLVADVCTVLWFNFHAASRLEQNGRIAFALAKQAG